MAEISDITLTAQSIPGLEIGTGTATDGETFTSRKFGNGVITAQASFMEDLSPNTSSVDCAISGSVVTFHCAGVTDKKISFVITGN